MNDWYISVPMNAQPSPKLVRCLGSLWLTSKQAEINVRNWHNFLCAEYNCPPFAITIGSRLKKYIAYFLLRRRVGKSTFPSGIGSALLVHHSAQLVSGPIFWQTIWRGCHLRELQNWYELFQSCMRIWLCLRFLKQKHSTNTYLLTFYSL